MNIYPRHISLHGELKLVSDILAKPEAYGKEDWQVQWLDFLASWYNKLDYIEVQTSGSTGKPKTIRLQKSFVAQSAMRTISAFKLQAGDKVLHCLPTKFIAGKLMLVRALIGQLDIYIVDPASQFSILKQNCFRFAAMVINQVDKLFCLGNKWNIDQLLIGGSAIPKTLEQKLQHVSTLCYSSYAMTETATHIALRKLNGQASHVYECLQGISVSCNDNDCLVIHMDGLTNGELHTNDIAKCISPSTFQILGRADHCIISGGMKFHPEQIEQRLQEHINSPFYISSLPHHSLGQQLVLHIVGKGTEQETERIRTILSQQLSTYEQAKQIIWHSSFPKTENGKLKRE